MQSFVAGRAGRELNTNSLPPKEPSTSGGSVMGCRVGVPENMKKTPTNLSWRKRKVDNMAFKILCTTIVS